MTKKICRCILALSREMFLKEALNMTGNVTKFNKASSALNKSGHAAGFRKANAAMAVNIANELVSRGVSFNSNDGM